MFISYVYMYNSKIRIYTRQKYSQIETEDTRYKLYSVQIEIKIDIKKKFSKTNLGFLQMIKRTKNLKIRKNE